MSFLIATILLLLLIDQYLFCPVYTFTKSTPFAGDSIYNPYAAAVQQDWVKCNFHAHVHCWKGVTNGERTAHDVYSVYNNLHYGVHAISNYQSIDTTFHTAASYISGYEHGYNMKKNHQLVIGASKVCWKDYLFPQTVYNKQNILNHLSSTDTGALIVINHPLLRNGYCLSDFTQLSSYNCIEVLNPACKSSALWDAALSAGKPVFIIADDDVHDVFDTNRVGSMCTFINVPKTDKENIVQSLKKGCSYGMLIGNKIKQEERKGVYDDMPELTACTMQMNKLSVQFNLPASQIIISGENGKILATARDADSLSYCLAKQEPYARITASYSNGTQLLLNPVFRFRKTPSQQRSIVSINSTETLFFRTIGAVVVFFWFNMMFKILIPKKLQNIPLRLNNKYGRGDISVSNISKNNQVWYRRLNRYVFRLLYHLGMQRENRTE